MRATWPMAATACFSGMVLGRSLRPSLPRPAAMAPELTSTSSLPPLTAEATSSTSRETFPASMAPDSSVRLDEPTFTTIRLASLSRSRADMALLWGITAFRFKSSATDRRALQDYRALSAEGGSIRNRGGPS